jgi:hypothetical protein
MGFANVTKDVVIRIGLATQPINGVAFVLVGLVIVGSAC